MSSAHGRYRVRQQRCPVGVSLNITRGDTTETYDGGIKCDVGSHDECADQ